MMGHRPPQGHQPQHFGLLPHKYATARVTRLIRPHSMHKAPKRPNHHPMLFLLLPHRWQALHLKEML